MKKTDLHSSKIKAIVFDVGNVLVHWDPRNAFTPLFQGRKDELDFFLNNICNLEWHTRHDQGIPFNDNIKYRQKQFPEYADMIAAFDTEWDNMFGGTITGTVDLLHQLKENGYLLFALTNFAAEKFHSFRQKNDYMNLFQDIIVSGEEKITKPDPAIYHILLNRINFSAHQILFIDDRAENLVPAQALGLHTHHFTSPEALNADLVIRNILPD